MVHSVKDMSADQRSAIESLLGRHLRDEEKLSIRPITVVKEAPTGEERTRAARLYLDSLDHMADRVKDIPDEELDAAINEALEYVRREPE